MSAKNKKEKNTDNSLKDKNLRNSPGESAGCEAREEDECSACE